jgi:hypothetical protein
VWTYENTVIAVGYLALIGGLWSVIFYLERRTRLIAQIAEVKSRLTQPRRAPHYATKIQMADGSLVMLTSMVRLHVGEQITVDLANGHITSVVPGAKIIGTVVEQQVLF